MNKNFIIIRIDGQLKNPTNYVWNNVRLIYIDVLKLPTNTIYQNKFIKILQNKFLQLDDAWTWSGNPDPVKTKNILQNLILLKAVL